MPGRTVAFIPVRGGSKGIPGKNVKPLGGRPLVLWTVEAAARSGAVDAVYVATDDAAIRAVVEGAGLANVRVVDRDPATATDTASTESAMIEFARREEFDTMVLLQATSPLTTTDDVAAAVARVRETGADSLVSVVRQKRFLWTEEGGVGRALNYDPLRRPRRQEFDGHLVENGAVYVCSREGLLAHGCRLFGRIAVHEMAEDTFLEIDEPADWAMLEALVEARRREAAPDAEILRRIRAVVTDVDGCLTDAGMYYTEAGDEIKKFTTRDGMGLERVRLLGLKTGIVTSEDTAMVARRGAKLKVDVVRQGVKRKEEILDSLCAELGVAPEEIAYVGDDLNDLGLLRRVGFSACPADARPEVRAVVRRVLSARGGEGAIRELCDAIAEARGGAPVPRAEGE